MKVSSFDSDTTPWRVMLPARYSVDRKRKARYFKTKEEAQLFVAHIRKFGISGSRPSDEVHLQLALDDFCKRTGYDRDRAIITMIKRLAAMLNGDRE